jgi:nitrogen fixation NifU-like protein
MDDMYRENILEHYRHPLNFGQLDDPTFEAEGVNPLCGDELHVQVQVGDEGVVTQVRFSGHGCAISQASMSMLSEAMIGKQLDEVAAMSREDITEMLGIPLSPVRLKCALLGLVVTKMGMHEHAGTAPPAGWEGVDEIAWGGAGASE